jgi:oligogalacturonide lyase
VGGMREAPPPVRRWTRRSLLGAAAGNGLWPAKSHELAGEAKKFLDAATEFEILRVSDLSHNAWLPLASNRALTRKGEALVFASDAGGIPPQLFRHDFKANKIRQLTEAEKLNTNTFTLTAADRTLLFIDGRKLIASVNAKDRVVHELPEEWAQSPRIAASDDGLIVVTSASNGSKTRIVLTGRTPVTLEERDGDIGTLHIRPKRAGVSYVASGELRYLPIDSRRAVTLRTAPGEVLSAHWSPDGASLLYLLKPAEAGRLIEIREVLLEGEKDVLVAKTSQYAHFQRNGDATVFLGASGSKASPHLLLLLRSVKRELTICEHRCSDARLSRAVFSPNSSRVAFQTDRHGNLVIYSMAVDRLIEQTEENT